MAPAYRCAATSSLVKVAGRLRYRLTMVPLAYLRAFEPLDELPSDDRTRWRAYVDRGDGITLGTALQTEARIAAVRVLTGRDPAVAETALVRRVNGNTFICPIDLELRLAVARVTFREMLPSQVADSFVAEEEARRALDSIASAARAPHIREASWSVPLHWFVLFDPDERHFVDPPEAASPRLSYLTSATAAVTRLERAIELVDTFFEDGEDVLNVLADLGEWLDDFHPASIVELDYGTVAGLVPKQALAADRTCEDLWHAIDRLAEGDLMSAAAFYGAARSRWARLEHKQQAS